MNNRWILPAAVLMGASVVAAQTNDPWNPPKERIMWDTVVTRHANAAWNQANGHLVLMSWFPSTNTAWINGCIVNDKGEVRTYSESTVSGRGPRIAQLTPQELDRIRQALAQLPAETGAPSTNRMLIVSFADHGTWQTRRYDRVQRPKAVIDLNTLTKAGIEEMKNSESPRQD